MTNHTLQISWRYRLAKDNINFTLYKNASNYIKNFNLKRRRDFYNWAKSKDRPAEFPRQPEIYFEKSWSGWANFLGYYDKTNYASYDEAKKKLAPLNFTTIGEFKSWRKESPENEIIPNYPEVIYKKSWSGWADFFSNTLKSPKNIKYISYKNLQKLVQKDNVIGKHAYREWWKKNKHLGNIPSTPDRKYKEWNGWGEFLGTGVISSHNRTYLSYEESKKTISKLNIKTQKQFQQMANIFRGMDQD